MQVAEGFVAVEEKDLKREKLFPIITSYPRAFSPLSDSPKLRSSINPERMSLSWNTLSFKDVIIGVCASHFCYKLLLWYSEQRAAGVPRLKIPILIYANITSYWPSWLFTSWFLAIIGTPALLVGFVVVWRASPAASKARSAY